VQVDAAPAEYERGTYLVDFHADFRPFQSRRFRIRFGDGVQGSPLPEQGHVLQETGDHFLIVNAPYLTWKIPRNLSGLLTSMNFPPCEHIRKGGAGLYLVDRTGNRTPVGGKDARAAVLRRGPSVVHLRFSRKHSRPTGLVSQVDLIFPVTRSWVEVVHRVVQVKKFTVKDQRCGLRCGFASAEENPALKETIQAMLCGETVIHGATLWFLGDDVYGQADVLVRCDNHASDLRNFTIGS
jgi:hypothetical protein